MANDLFGVPIPPMRTWRVTVEVRETGDAHVFDERARSAEEAKRKAAAEMRQLFRDDEWDDPITVDCVALLQKEAGNAKAE